ncbi:MAG: hemolysin family protein [Methanoregulaceae archaeon]|nr:hemolysin family protein [Methanoregulaceae archaeon]
MIADPIKIVLFLICLALSAFFSSSEVALISINRAKVRTLVNEGRKGSPALAELKESPDRILITILIGNNVVNVGAAALATAIAIEAFGDIGVGIATGFVTIVLLVFGEIGPKIYATRRSENFALSVAPPVLFLSRVFSPFIWLFEKVSGPRSTAQLADSVVTEEEIKEWIDVGKEGGTIEEEEKEMLYSVFEFGDTTAREIMTTRIDVVTIEDTSTLTEALHLFNEQGFSRIPVYHEHVDNIIGVLNVKDVYSVMISGKKEIPIKDLMYDPYFAPETKKIDDLLKELQLRKVQMAIILDEYSSFAGIVTVEDILEELVGDILDEFDHEEPDIQKTNEGVYLIDAQMWVEDLNDELSLSLPVHESYETIGGLLIERLGHIPHPGESVEIRESRITLVVTQMRARRIVKVKLIQHGLQEEGTPGQVS